MEPAGSIAGRSVEMRTASGLNVTSELCRWRNGTSGVSEAASEVARTVNLGKPEPVWKAGDNGEQADADLSLSPARRLPKPRLPGQAEADTVTDSDKDRAAGTPLIITGPREFTPPCRWRQTVRAVINVCWEHPSVTLEG